MRTEGAVGPRRSNRRRVTLVLAAALVGVLGVTTGAVRTLGAQAVPDASPLHQMDWGRQAFILTEVLELAPDAAARPVLFDLTGWIGGSSRRLWFKADGSAATVGGGSAGGYQVLYGRLVSPFWDAMVGLRADLATGGGTSTSRIGAVLGLQGLAPGWFEVEPSLFVTSEGAVSVDLTGSYDLYVTQRLVLQPRLETSAALRDDREFGIGSGLSDGSLALRARYEIRREFAPYVGVLWERRFGRTADFARTAGGDVGETLLVLGVRLWR